MFGKRWDPNLKMMVDNGDLAQLTCRITQIRYIDGPNRRLQQPAVPSVLPRQDEHQETWHQSPQMMLQPTGSSGETLNSDRANHITYYITLHMFQSSLGNTINHGTYVPKWFMELENIGVVFTTSMNRPQPKFLN